MARTIPALSGLTLPQVDRFLSGMPIVAGDGVAPGRWLDVALASNLAYAVDGMGPCANLAWQDGQINDLAGAYSGAADWVKLRLPASYPDTAANLMARLRLRAWGETGTGVATVTLTAVGAAGSAVVTLGTPFGRFPAPASPAILDVASGIADDGDGAGPYVDLDLRLSGFVKALQSVHLDWLEYTFAGTGGGGTYPAAAAWPAGAVGDFVAADTADFVDDAPLSSDLLFQRSSQWRDELERRRVKLLWASAQPDGSSAPDQYWHMAPHRLLSVAPMVTSPGEDVEPWTVAAYCHPDATETEWVFVGQVDAAGVFTELTRLEVPPDPAFALTGQWYQRTFTPIPSSDLGAPPAHAGMLHLAVIASGAAPVGDTEVLIERNGAYADARQANFPAAASAFRVRTVVVWGP